MKKVVLVVVTAAAVVAAALVPSGPAVVAATASRGAAVPTGFASALSAVNQPTWQTNASVNALATAGNTVYAGGLFTRVRPPRNKAGVGDAARKYFAAFNRTTGVPTRFAPQVNGPVWTVVASPDGKWLAIGGDFTVVDGQPRPHLALFNVASGKLVAGWNPAPNYRVAALALTGNTLYFGGSFRKVGAVKRDRVAAVTLTTGALLPWNPQADDDVHAIELSTDRSRVFVGGAFTAIGGLEEHAIAMLNPTTGAGYSMPAAAAIPEPTPDCDSRVKDIEVQGDRVFIANAGSGVGCYDGVISADAKTGKVVWQSHCLGATEAIKAIGPWLYKGSHAHDCSEDGEFADGTGNHRLLVYNTQTGKLGPWFPNTDAAGETLVGPLAFASGGNDLWVGGDFTAVNGRSQQGLTRFNNVPGGAVPGVPAAPKLASARANKVTVAFATVADLDSMALTYSVFRGTTKIGSWTRSAYPWAPRVISVTDTHLTSKQTLAYHVEVTDGRNVTKGKAAAVKVR
jgi:hypothetical protein